MHRPPSPAALAALLKQVPSDLASVRGTRFPLLMALCQDDSVPGRGARLAKDLVLISALVHDDVDERRTAEYLLRNRADVAAGRRPAEALLSAARCAAEMDCRRRRHLEVTSNHPELASARGDSLARVADPSVPEFVLAYLQDVTDQVAISTRLQDQILAGVTIALEVSQRHVLKNGHGPSVIAMRSDARPAGRLVTHLRAEFGRTTVAVVLSRILVGPDGSPIETSLLWWAAQGRPSAGSVPRALTQRWTRSLADLTAIPGACAHREGHDQ